MKRYRIGRKLLQGFGALGAGFLTYKAVTSEEGLDIYNVGIARFGRAAVAVGALGIDYKRTMSANSNEETSKYDQAISDCHYRSANRLLKLCRDNGGVFIKVGQHIGALDYLLPEEYVSTMQVLHNRAPEMDVKQVYAVIREDLKQEPEELFSEFDERPLGTASLAQVHRAKLKDSNQEVAVKVQHRYVKNHSMGDIYTCEFLVHTVKFFFPQFEFMWLAEEMRKNLPLELSFIQEGKNAEKISNMLQHFPWLVIPKIYWKQTTDRVLVMEYIKGIHINDIDNLKKAKMDLVGISKKISQIYADMIFKYGYVHCDPHPGNVLVRQNARGSEEIVLLDHGLYTQLNNEFRINYSQFWLSILNANQEGIKEYADKLGVGQLYGLFACMVAGRSWSSITKGIDKSEKTKAEGKEIKANVARYIKEIADVLAFVNRQMILIFKTNDLLRTIEHNLGTSNSMLFFVQMSRACFRCLNEERLRLSTTFWGRSRANLAASWDQFKISMYQIFLWLYWSPAGRIVRNNTLR